MASWSLVRRADVSRGEVTSANEFRVPNGIQHAITQSACAIETGVATPFPAFVLMREANE